MDSTALMLWGVVFSSIGFGFFLYGKKQNNYIVLLCGVVLMIYPYFVTNSYILVLIGVIIMAVPYFWKD
jgi:hypothetical protein